MHSTVLVVGDVESQMAPFQQNNMGNCPAEYLEFIPEKKHEEMVREYKSENNGQYKDLKHYVEQQYGYKQSEDGKWWGYVDNPNCRWDWYQVGGRWAGSLIVKEGKKHIVADSGLMKNVAWDLMQKREEKVIRNAWKKYMSKKNRIRRVVDEGDLRNECQIPQDCNSLKDYIEKYSKFKTYSFLDADGEWYDEVTQEKFDELLSEVPEDYDVTVVDYHM